MGDKNFKKEKYHLTFADLIEFFRCEIIIMGFEVSSFSLEDQVARDDCSRYKHAHDIITKADIIASMRKVSTGITRIPTFTIDPIFSDFLLELNRLWSGLLFYPGIS